MSGTIAHPIAWAALVEYWAGDLPPQAADAIEEHLMGCRECSALSARVAEITESLRTTIPPLLTADQLAEFVQRRGLRVVENFMQPGERREVVFPAHADILLHRLGGLSIAPDQRVQFEMRVESTGELLSRVEDAPVDRARGELLVACQRHFAAMPPDTMAELRVVDPSGSAVFHRYIILHRF